MRKARHHLWTIAVRSEILRFVDPHAVQLLIMYINSGPVPAGGTTTVTTTVNLVEVCGVAVDARAAACEQATVGRRNPFPIFNFGFHPPSFSRQTFLRFSNRIASAVHAFRDFVET